MNTKDNTGFSDMQKGKHVMRVEEASVQLFVPDSTAMEELGAFLASFFHPGDLVYLMGALGAGKTTFVLGAARALGYTGRVTSPTFTIMNQYDCTPPVVHLDFYRLESPGMMADLGLDDYMHREAVMLIEWPQIGLETLPDPRITVDIQLVDDDYDRGRNVIVTLNQPEQEDRDEFREETERLRNYADTRS